MDFLNKSIAQVSELFRSMTPGARITAGLLLAVVVVSMGYLFRHASAGPDAYLFGGEALSDGQLTRVEAAIAQAGLSGYVREGNRIRVPAGQQAAYLAAVADAGALPPNFNTILENALDKGGPWESREATRERLKIAKQQTLSEIVRAMSWVEKRSCCSTISSPARANSLTVTNQVTASVSVRPIVGESLDPRRAKNIEKLVASAVSMSPENVTVTNLGEGTAIAGDGSIDPGHLRNDDYMQTKVAFEMQKRASIINSLRDIPGVRVEVNADFDNTEEETTRGVKPDPKAVTAASEITSNDTTTQSTADNGGRPGLEAQGSQSPTAAAAAPAKHEQDNQSKTTDTQNVVGVEETDTKKHGLTPKEVWATVTIPGKYVEDIWKQRNPTATEPPKPEDLRAVQAEVVAKVENIVEPLLLLQAFTARTTTSTSKSWCSIRCPCRRSSRPRWPARRSPGPAAIGARWRCSAWPCSACSCCVRWCTARRPAKAQRQPRGAPTLTLHADEPTKAGTRGGQRRGRADRPRLRLKKGKSLKDDLVEIVREDPDAAADILRSWIGKAEASCGCTGRGRRGASPGSGRRGPWAGEPLRESMAFGYDRFAVETYLDWLDGCLSDAVAPLGAHCGARYEVLRIRRGEGRRRPEPLA